METTAHTGRLGDAGGPGTLVNRLARRPTAWGAVVVLVMGVAGTASLLDGVLEGGDLSLLDPGIADAVPHLRERVLTVVAELVTYLGSTAVVALLGAALVGWVWLRWRDRLGATVIAGAMGTAAALTLLVKHLVDRTRPPAADVLGALDSSPSFPSGHTLGTTVLLGLVAGVVVLRASRAAVRVAAVAAWAVGSLLVAASRVYLGYHWATDVLAGLVLGTAVLAAAAVVVDVLRTRDPDWVPAARR